MHVIFRPRSLKISGPRGTHRRFLAALYPVPRRLITRVIKRPMSRNYGHYSVCQLALARMVHHPPGLDDTWENRVQQFLRTDPRCKKGLDVFAVPSRHCGERGGSLVMDNGF